MFHKHSQNTKINFKQVKGTVFALSLKTSYIKFCVSTR